MGLKIVRFRASDGDARWGILRNTHIDGLATQYDSHGELLQAYADDPVGFTADTGQRIERDAVTLLAPVVGSPQIFCQGLNYETHRDEGGVATRGANRGENLIFTKPPSAITGPSGNIVRPANCELLDYEVELALVMKRDLPVSSIVTPDTLLDYVGAITLTNDVSARDLMFGAPMMQWFKGKGQRTFCPTGPVLYLLGEDDQGLLDRLRLRLSLNGQLRQDATTDQLIFKPHETLTELAEFTDVQTGDMVLTGTPGGVILNASPKVGLAIVLNFTNDARRKRKLVATQSKVRYLQPGDELRLSLCSSDGQLDLGEQRCRVVDASA